MSFYFRGVEIREIDDALYAEWVARGNPKASIWTVLPETPTYNQQTHSVSWDGTQWVVSPLPQRTVPDAVDAHKFKIALRRNGLRAAFDTYLTTAGANEKDFWTSAPAIKKGSRYLDSLKTALSLTNAQVRNLLIAADDEQD